MGITCDFCGINIAIVVMKGAGIHCKVNTLIKFTHLQLYLELMLFLQYSIQWTNAYEKNRYKLFLQIITIFVQCFPTFEFETINSREKYIQHA